MQSIVPGDVFLRPAGELLLVTGFSYISKSKFVTVLSNGKMSKLNFMYMQELIGEKLLNRIG